MINGKPVILNGKETQYFLFENGDLYNANTHRISQGSVNHGYIRYSLTVDGVETSVFKHRLLAELFIGNDDPEHKTVVHHKDGCTQNNELNNLEWTSQKDNCNKRINPPQHRISQQLTEEELKQEEWRPFRNTQYEISNMGRIKTPVQIILHSEVLIKIQDILDGLIKITKMGVKKSKLIEQFMKFSTLMKLLMLLIILIPIEEITD